MTEQSETPAFDWRVRERSAQQLVAVMAGDWSRPTTEQMLNVLVSARWMVEATLSPPVPEWKVFNIGDLSIRGKKPPTPSYHSGTGPRRDKPATLPMGWRLGRILVELSLPRLDLFSAEPAQTDTAGFRIAGSHDGRDPKLDCASAEPHWHRV